MLPAPAHAWTLTTLYSFQGGSDGAYPYAGLLKVGGVLYGTTEEGGTANAGTVFKIDPATHDETVAYSFGAGGEAVNPLTPLINVGGTVYGTTSSGGTSGGGTVFMIDIGTGAAAVLHAFSGGSDGAQPQGVIDIGDRLYGTTAQGGGTGCGGSGCGTVFAIDRRTRTESVLYSFGGGSDGATPYAGLTNVGGMLYGTTLYGGSSSYGTVFEINPATGAESVLYSFGGVTGDGLYPYAGLINVGGTLYGTTEAGGTWNDGSAFAIDLATGAETVLHSFGGGGDGRTPEAALHNVSGKLYGTTVEGGGTGCGGYGCGTVFKINRVTGAETIVHSFTGSDGEYLRGALINIDGVLYGTGNMGGAHGYGTVFSLTP